jgi:hypothetical protein
MPPTEQAPGAPAGPAEAAAGPGAARRAWDKANEWAEPLAERGEKLTGPLEKSRLVKLGEAAHRGETAKGIWEHSREGGAEGAEGGAAGATNAFTLQSVGTGAKAGADAARAQAGSGGAPKGAAHEGGGGTAPVVESVNPKYKSPPGTKQQIAQLEKDIEKVLAARAAAEQREAKATSVQSKLTAQKGQITAAQKGVQKGISATQAHQQAVQHKQQLNEQSKQKQAEGGGKVNDAASQLAGIATLETLLAGWTGFTGLVLKFSDVLPGGMVGQFQKMNSDGAKFMASLVKSKAAISAQQGQAGPQAADLAQKGSRIQATHAAAGATAGQFAQASGGATQLAQSNTQHSAYIGERKAKASKDKAKATEGHTTLQTKKDTLQSKMEAWASEHKADRQKAVDETVKKMEAKGLKVTKKPSK